MSEIIIRSVQRSIETGEEIVDETKRTGEFHKIGETVYITYEDIDKENGNKSFNRIKIKDDLIERAVKGDLDSTMIFRKGHETTTNYITPYGVITLKILTKYLNVEDTESYNIHLEYILSMDGKPHTDNEMIIKVK